MAEANQYLSRLQFFCESFTGFPVRVLIPSTAQSLDEEVQAQSSLRIYVPQEVNPKARTDEEMALKIYKGIVALQASAVLYNGIPTEEIKARYETGRADVSLDDLILGKPNSTGILPACFNTIELSRRMACIKEDYPVLYEDIQDGFLDQFDASFILDTSRNPKHTNEVDLVITRVLWENLGVDKTALDKIVDRVSVDDLLGEYRHELYDLVKGKTIFPDALKTSVEDSILRLTQFRRYMGELSYDLGVGSFFLITTDESLKRDALRNKFFREKDPEGVKRVRNEKIKKRKEELEGLLNNPDKARVLFGEKAEEIVRRRISAVEKYELGMGEGSPLESDELAARRKVNSERYCLGVSSASSIDKVFSEVPKERLLEPEIPKTSEKEEAGKIVYLPELRNGFLVHRAVRAVIYDLMQSRPLTDEQQKRESGLLSEIKRLEQRVYEATRKIQSDINYVYDLKTLQNERTSDRRRIARLKNELETSRAIHKEASTRETFIDGELTRKIRMQMERIKPQARTIVRNCFEGELDEKKYFDYWLETQAGGNPLPNFYYQWQNRRRDVASVVLLDASSSTDRVSFGDKTVLDLMKEGVFYLVVGAETLEDKIAVLAYNGRGHKDLRIYLLKDFDEGLGDFKEHLQHLRPELNNRDGAAIRYAAQFLGGQQSKTKFLFHIGDMQPSDSEFESLRFAGQIQSVPYEGVAASEDVVSAFNYARGFGIIPAGICVRRQVKPANSEKMATRGKINPEALAKLRKQKEEHRDVDYDDRLSRSFRANYRVVNNTEELPRVMRKIYVQLSFR